MIIDRLKADIGFAVKARSELATGILRLVLGECQLRDNYSDDFIIGFCRKLIEANLETMRLAGEKVTLLRQNELLRDYMPAMLAQDEVRIHADHVSPEIMAAKSEGQAIGCLIRHLKGLGLSTTGEIAKFSVQKIRQGIKV